MSKFKTFFTFILCSLFCAVSFAQVFDTERKGKFPYRYSEFVPVQSNKVISKCHQVYILGMNLKYGNYSSGDPEVSLWNIGGPGTDIISFGDYKNTNITIENNKVKFEYNNIPGYLTITYLGKCDNKKSYEISGCDSDGIEFKRTIRLSGYSAEHDSPITYYRYNDREVSKKSYNPQIGQELMSGDEPVLLELVKKWASKFKKATVIDLR